MQVNTLANDSETYTLTPSSILLQREGNVCVLTLVNYVSLTAITTDTKLCDLPVSAKFNTYSVAKTIGNSDALIFVYQNGLYASGVTGLPANVQTYGTLVFTI